VNGIKVLGSDDGACWFDGSFDRGISKVEVVEVVSQFVLFVIGCVGFRVEYACTSETTKRSI
jgi:hypothetical protein